MFKLKYANTGVILFFIVLHSLNSFAQDTTNVKIDSLKIYPPLKSSGKVLLLDSSSFITISKQDIQRASYTTFFDILKSRNVSYPLSLGFYGQNNSFAFLGAYPRSLSVRMDYTPMNEQDIGIFNLSQIPPEQIENAQIFIGSDAVILSDNANGVFINFQENVFNTKNPYSKIVYSQASDDFIGADGIFSQNFAKNWNFSFGFRSLTSADRFTNSNLKSWNLRSSIRYNIDSCTNIALSENYLDYSVGENGGVDYKSNTDLYDPIASIVLLNSFNESAIRNNLILDFNKVFGNDYNTAISSKLFFSYTDNKFNDGNYIFTKPLDSNQSFHYFDYYLGNSTVYEKKIKNFYESLGFDAYLSKVQQSELLAGEYKFNYSFFELIKYNFPKNIQVSFGTRFTQKFSKTAFSYGAKLEYKPDSSKEIFIDVSNSDRMPSLIEGDVKSENHLLGILGFSGKWKSIEANGQLFARQIKNPIIFFQSIDSTDTTQQYFSTSYKNSSLQNIFGLNFNLKLEPIKHIVFEGFAQLNYTKNDVANDKIYPKVYGGISCYYKVEVGRSDAQVGVEFEFMSAFKGYSYFPGYAGYYSNPYESNFQTNGLNLFARLKLGDAYVRAEFRNALGQNYYYVPFYPELGRHFRVIVNWAFMN
ncbi:MAG: TonB-dependent receptor plug domain-containing protein [Chloroherpetonaceae bacterium]